MTIAVPMLSPAGWVRSPNEKADALISHFYLSEHSQSYLYAGNISNLQYIIEQNTHDMVALTNQLRLELERYLGRYYDTANVDIKTDDVPENLTGKITITLNCVVTESGKQYMFGRLLKVTNSKIQEIIDLNNNENLFTAV